MAINPVQAPEAPEQTIAAPKKGKKPRHSVSRASQYLMVEGDDANIKALRGVTLLGITRSTAELAKLVRRHRGATVVELRIDENGNASFVFDE